MVLVREDRVWESEDSELLEEQVLVLEELAMESEVSPSMELLETD